MESKNWNLCFQVIDVYEFSWTNCKTLEYNSCMKASSNHFSLWGFQSIILFCLLSGVFRDSNVLNVVFNSNCKRLEVDLHKINVKQHCKIFVNELKKTLVEGVLRASLSVNASATYVISCRNIKALPDCMIHWVKCIFSNL